MTHTRSSAIQASLRGIADIRMERRIKAGTGVVFQNIRISMDRKEVEKGVGETRPFQAEAIADFAGCFLKMH